MLASRFALRRAPLGVRSTSAYCIRTFTSTSPVLGEQFDVTVIGTFPCDSIAMYSGVRRLQSMRR